MSDVDFDLSEWRWLQDNPAFAERPATFDEFLGPRYLNNRKAIRPGAYRVLKAIIGAEVNTRNPTNEYLAMMAGAIGIGKSYTSGVLLAYVVHWTLCLKDPQEFFGLDKGSKIAFAVMSTTEKQARGVAFDNVKARINFSPWFNDPAHPERLPNPKFKNIVEWTDRYISILPGTSQETSYEGYNILGAVIDEMDSHKITDRKDYGEAGFETIYNRMNSRFDNRGFIFLAGQLKSQTGFAQRKWDELEKAGHFVFRCTIWDSRGWEHYKDPTKGELFGVDEDGDVKHFFYDTQRYEVVPSQVVKWGQREVDDTLLKVPLVYMDQFMTNGPKALKDLAGMPPLVGDPFIPDASKVLSARLRWMENNLGRAIPIDRDGRVGMGFKAENKIKRVMHIDMGLSGDGDALGMAMGHVSGVREVDGEVKAMIEFDLLRQWTVKPGRHIELAMVRRFIYSLVDDMKFKLALVTFDGFENTDFSQQLHRRRIRTGLLSADKSYAPYHDLREAIYEDRVSWPLYEVRSRKNEGEYFELAFSELTQLVDDGKKVDHTATSTKDLADAMAGVVHTLMTNPMLHRRGGKAPSSETTGLIEPTGGAYGAFTHPAYIGDRGVRKPDSLNSRNGSRL